MDIWCDEDSLLFIKSHSFRSTVTLQDKRRIKSRCRRYRIEDNDILFQDRIVPPPFRRRDIMKSMHEAMGHPGHTRTAEILAAKYFWKNMRGEIKDFVKRCEPCQIANAVQKTSKITLTQEIVPSPWVSLAIDLCEPSWMLPLSATRSGLFRYIMVTVDRFSKWVELLPLESKSSKEISEKFESQILYRLGSPKEIISDNGSEFEGHFSNLIEKWKIKRVKSRPYHPQGNGLAEATVRSIKKRLLAKLIEDGVEKQWESLLPSVQFAYNSCPHTSTGVAPFDLMFQRQSNGPLSQAIQSEALNNALRTAIAQRTLFMRRSQRKCESTEEVTIGKRILWVQKRELNKKRIHGPFDVTEISSCGNWITVEMNGLYKKIPKEETVIFYQ